MITLADILNARGQYLSVSMNQGNILDTRFGAKITPSCADDEFLDGVKCTACDQNQGSFSYQADECVSCGDMWNDSKSKPDSLEYIISGQICGDPEAVYLAENSSGSVQEVVEEPVEEEEPEEEDHSHHHHGPHDTEELEEDESIQIETLSVGSVTQDGTVQPEEGGIDLWLIIVIIVVIILVIIIIILLVLLKKKKGDEKGTSADKYKVEEPKEAKFTPVKNDASVDVT